MIDIVFLHGFFSSPQSRKIQHFLNIFPQSAIGELIHSYIAVDLYSKKSDFEEMTITSLVNKVVSIINQRDRRVVLVGSSHGGLVALAVAQQLDQNLGGLVLLAPAIYYYDLLQRRMGEKWDAWRESGYQELDFFRYDGKTKWNWDYVKDLATYQSFEVIQIPTLLIHGESDTVIPVADSKRFVQQQEMITPHYLPDGHHDLNNVLDQVSDLIIRWIITNFT